MTLILPTKLIKIQLFVRLAINCGGWLQFFVIVGY